MRASDADRERVAEMLREHAGEGRLEPDELEQRLEVAYSAKTLGELDALTVDLPVDTPSRERAYAPHLHPLLLVLVALLAVSAIVGHPIFWFAFPLFFWLRGPMRWRRI
jgi:hypothetical protein